ncbi:MAG: dockerin type I domain-containing protein [Acutalibacteraceae bacterium]|nr:dockerin type I domain-containing protein [Acutalibacteraceae bacterium]
MEEVFEYVKIDSTVDTSNAYYDPSACDEGVTYEGSEGEVYMAESSISTFSEIEGSAEYTHSFSVSKTSGGASIQGGLDFLARASAKVYFTQIYQYVEFKIDYSASFGGTLSGSAGMKFAFGYFGISPVAGVYIDFTPSFVFRADAELSVTLTLTGTLGMSSSNKNGIQNISTLPKLMPEVKAEGIFFIGISLEPQIKVLGSAIVAEMGGEFGGEITAVLNDNEDNTEDVKHECKMCIAGEVNAVSSLNFGVKFLNNDDWKFGLKVSVLDIKVTDFYYSFDYDEFDFTTCPHYTYRVTVTALDEKGNPLSGIFVNDRYITDTSGKTEIYFPAGTYLITAKGIGLNGSNRITVDDKPASVKVVLREEESNDEDSDDSDFNSNTILSLGTSHSGYVTEDGDLYMWGWNKQGQLGDGTTTNRYTPTKIMSNVRAVSLGDRHSAAITETGDLYIWGYNDEGQLGNGTNGDYYIVTPTKIMSNVKAVSLSDSHSAAITETGDLYMWGRNNYGQLGDGTTTDRYVPTKIMNNVKAVSLGGSHSAAITETGDLYTWGVNSFGQLGVGISGFDNGDSCRVTPTKIMSNIKAVSLEGSNSAAITEDGDLYMWGWNRQGQIGDGTTTDRYSPTKIMNNVKAVSLGISHSAAIIEPGDLYTWGWNALGQLGNGTAGYDTYEDYSDDYIVTPKKVMSAVKTVSLGVNFSGAITEPGDLYMWGDNEWGQIGDGTAGMDSVNIYDMYIATPTKIISDKSSVQSIEAHDEAIVYTNLTASDFENNTVQTESFSGLLPNEVYNFYSMKTRDTVKPFDNSNLLYITQVTTDENGNLSISYIPDEEYENAVNFVVPFKQIDLSNAEVKMDDLVYSGETQYVSPVVTLNGRILTEGVDYDLHGDYSAKDIGDYNVTIVGRGLYNGEINISYSVSSADAAVGDVNNDGKIDIADATDIQRYISNLLDFNDEQKNAADIDKNGVINIIDVTQIQRYLANFIPSLG